ncbi:MAG TPA: hypothetical protein VFU51_06455 [Gaiellaceae bacterium]|nr:hypothetical protein [Gaiellaceae bacterium]
MREPMSVRFTDQRHAASLAHALDGLGGLTVHRHTGSCEVDGVNSDRAIVVVLDAIRDTLAGDPASSASVLLDGREYHMQAD